MNVFKTFTFTWQQGLLFKWGVFAIEIAVGAYWSEFFVRYIFPLRSPGMPACGLLPSSRGGRRAAPPSSP
jgi:hypothetical protein